MKKHAPWIMALASCLIATDTQAQTLAEALDNTSLAWISSGSSRWQGQTTETHDGVDAAKSGFVSMNGSSTLQTTVTGPGTLTFWWKVSCSSSDAGLTCKVGGAAAGNIVGLVDWTQMTLYVGAGSQVIQWIYTRHSMPAYSDAGWVDQVVYTPGAVAPELALEPAGQSQIQGWNATFAATCTGTPAFTYQWRCNGTNIPGATAAAYTITNVQPDRVGHYSLAVTNEAGGVVSADAPLVLGRIATWGLTSPAPPDLTNALAVAAGGLHRVALRPEHTVAAWGYNAYHQTEAPGELTNAVAVAAGDHFSMALKNDGTVVAWGENAFPNGTVTGQTNVPANLTNVIAIAAGGWHALALKSDGTVVAWGGNDYGQTNVPAGLSKVVAIAAGMAHSLALQADGSVIAWGMNSLGETNVPAGLTNVVAVAAGDSHSLALNGDGSVVAWGWNSMGQTNVPVGLSNVVAVAAGNCHSLLLLADGTAVAWGQYPASGGFRPMSVPFILTNVVAISAHYFQCLALVGEAGPEVYSLPMNPAWSGNVFSVSLFSQYSRVYRLEYQDDLSGSGWIGLPLVAGNGGPLGLSDPTATGGQRFYRVRRW